ncbi:hypothetical protein REH81_25975 [Vibrio rotiferianus]
MKKQNQTMSVTTLTTNDLLTDELTQQTDFTDRTYLQMKASFETRLKDLGYSLQKGKPFAEYYSAMKQGESLGKPIQNVTQLNDVVGGKFDKSRAAYEAYTEFCSLNLPIETVPQEFSPVEYEKEIEELQTANRKLEVHNAQLMEQYRELQREYDSTNTERYRLEGRLEQYLSQQSLA